MVTPSVGADRAPDFTGAGSALPPLGAGFAARDHAGAQSAGCPMQSFTVTRWSDLLARLEQMPGWAFRGETCADWPLVSSLGRRLQTYSPDAARWPLREARALRVFRRKAHNYMREPFGADDTLRWLGLMQHHGAPTRLLDFTKSPFVAAFFALEHASGDAALYALNTPALWDAAPDFDPALTRAAIDPRLAGHYERWFLDNRWPLVWFGEPAQMDRRLVAQSGLFVVPGELARPLDALLAAYGDSDALIAKFVLPWSLRAEAMQALYRMNVTNASLFPDLEGLARSMAYELEVVWERLIDEDAPPASSRRGG